MIFLELFLTFFKIGAFTFGGGYAMLPLIQSEAIGNGWMTMEEIIDFIAVSESTPGPFAINMATFVGTQMGKEFLGVGGGILGAICATLGVVMPSFIVILFVAKFYQKFKENRIVAGCLGGLKPAAIGLICAAVISIGKTVFFPESIALSAMASYTFIFSVLLFAVTLFLALKKKMNPIYIIVISAVAGIGAGYLGEYMGWL
ncbi:MAG: chromate transporter [Clostridia bacterium]|nr:chromate transporter [Oscillospiraceae bacterium]MBQ2828510.1 chromate transporter [Clostridia bacterium]